MIIKILYILIPIILILLFRYVMFSKNKKINYGVKKVDRIVTGFIIGSALASIFGLTHTKKGKEISHEVKMRFSPTLHNASKKTVGGVGKILAFFAGIFSKK